MSVPRSIKDALSVRLGVIVADVRFVANSSSNSFVKPLTKRGISYGSIYTNLQEAHDSCIEGQNDVVVLTPGTHDINLGTFGEDGVLWDKDNTHLISSYPATQYNGQVRLASQGANGVNTTLSIQCKESIFMDFNVTNSHSATDDICAIQIGDGTNSTFRNNLFRFVGIAGCIGASALSDADSTSLRMKSAGNNLFEYCQIGHTIAQKTAANAALTFALGSTSWCSQNNTFRKCQLLSWSNTSTSYIVKSDGVNCMDRNQYFEDCLFSNFDNGGAKPAAVFHLPAGTPTGYRVVLRRCMQDGSTAWLSATSVSTNLVGDMVAAEATGGTSINPT